MIQPPSMGHHPGSLGKREFILDLYSLHFVIIGYSNRIEGYIYTLLKFSLLTGPPQSMGSSSLEALRAHAAQAAANMQQNLQSSPSPLALPPSKPPMVEEVVKIEPDPEPTPEEEGQSSPVAPSRGPSPEPRIEDTECHRSQSAM